MPTDALLSRALLVALLAPMAGCIPPGYGAQDYRVPSQLPPADDAPPIIPGPTDILPHPQPWEARPVVADARDVALGEYIVQPGDTLRGVARITGAGSEAIARANGVAPPFVIRAGQRLVIPAGRYHLVKSGETGIAIARAYGVEWARIVADNALSEPYILRVGQRISIPRAAPPTRAERAAAFHLDIDDIVTGSQPAIAEKAVPTKASPSPNRILPPGAAIAEPARLTGAFQWPVAGAVVTRFGAAGAGQRNNGIKIAVPLKTPVLAAADGVVAYTGADVAGLGGLVILKHGSSWTSVYGHNQQILVQRGQSVKRGQAIALSGDTGFADRPELHFELRKGRTPVDPVPELPKR
ncbi:MAG: M23 family metallopeptidase [Sphingomonas sp.]